MTLPIEIEFFTLKGKFQGGYKAEIRKKKSDFFLEIQEGKFFDGKILSVTLRKGVVSPVKEEIVMKLRKGAVMLLQSGDKIILAKVTNVLLANKD